VTGIYYEVRVAGCVPAEALADFEDLGVAQPVESVLYGGLPDQAALHGLLARLEMFGVQVLEIRRFREKGAGPAAGDRRAAKPSRPSHA
jgi:hypothetical protein